MTMKPLAQSQEDAYSLLRIVCGFLFFWHGTHKFLNYPIDFPYELSPLMMAAGAIELVTGLLVALGIATRSMAFLASGTMAFAYWLFHGTQAVLPIANKGELSVLFCFVFLFIACKGPGKWSIKPEK